MNYKAAPPVEFIHGLEQLAQVPETDNNHLQNIPVFLRRGTSMPTGTSKSTKGRSAIRKTRAATKKLPADDSAWSDIVSPRRTALFDRLVAHFFVPGFRSYRIDEFLAHISTIEAALGSPIDHNPITRARIASRPGENTLTVLVGVTARLRLRKLENVIQA